MLRNDPNEKVLFTYKCVDKIADVWKVYGPGLPKKGAGIDYLDEQTAKEAAAEFQKVYRQGWNDYG